MCDALKQETTAILIHDQKKWSIYIHKRHCAQFYLLSANDYMIWGSCKTEGKLSVILLYLGSFIIQDSKTCYTARNMLKKEFSLTFFFSYTDRPIFEKNESEKSLYFGVFC